MKFSEIVLPLFVICSAAVVCGKELPSYLELCQRRLPKKELAECMVKNVEILRPKLVKGIPEFYLPSIDPMTIPEACLQSGDFRACFRDLKFYHGQEFVLKGIDLDLDNYYLNLELHFPRLRIISNYDVKGRILVLELNGKGPADGNYTNVDLVLGLTGKSIKRRGKEFIAFEKQKIDLKIEAASLYFANIFGSNEELTTQANKIINDNILDVIDEFKPVIGEIIAKFIANIVDGIFSRYSLSQLFPDS